jgi:DNA-binding response OmpR family regulator
MLSGHCVLIVEDQVRIAKDLADILASIDCDTRIAHNKEDALALLEQEPPCLVLLDLSIPRTAVDIKGRPAVGLSLLQDIRARFGSPRDKKVWIPIVVVSGHAREVDQAVEIMKLDADDLIQKPYDEDVVIRKVREALRKSGREAHSACRMTKQAHGVGPSEPLPRPGDIIGIPGRAAKKQTLVTIGAAEVGLSDGPLVVLLRLMLAHTQGEAVPLSKFSVDDQAAYKAVTRLRNALRSVVVDPHRFILNADGTYALGSHVQLGEVNTTWLANRRNTAIADLALELEQQLKQLS